MNRHLFSLSILCLLAGVWGCPTMTGDGPGNDNTGDHGNANVNGNGNDNRGGDNQNDNGDVGQKRSFSATLTGGVEVPPVTTSASGRGTFTLSADETELEFAISASGLSGPVTFAHFHLGAVGVAGGIVFNLSDLVVEVGGSVSIEGVWSLSEEEAQALLDGDIYVNIHTAANLPGEIRGQLVEEG